jgi:hypothetical protein
VSLHALYLEGGPAVDAYPAGGDPLADLATVNSQLRRLGVAPIVSVDEARDYPPDLVPALVDTSRRYLVHVSDQLAGLI